MTACKANMPGWRVLLAVCAFLAHMIPAFGLRSVSIIANATDMIAALERLTGPPDGLEPHTLVVTTDIVLSPACECPVPRSVHGFRCWVFGDV